MVLLSETLLLSIMSKLLYLLLDQLTIDILHLLSHALYLRLSITRFLTSCTKYSRFLVHCYFSRPFHYYFDFASCNLLLHERIRVQLLCVLLLIVPVQELVVGVVLSFLSHL